MTHHI